jgi:hypothetical protein
MCEKAVRVHVRGHMLISGETAFPDMLQPYGGFWLYLKFV